MGSIRKEEAAEFIEQHRQFNSGQLVSRRTPSAIRRSTAAEKKGACAPIFVAGGSAQAGTGRPNSASPTR